MTDDGKAVETVDHNSDPEECKGNGGTWVDGFVPDTTTVSVTGTIDYVALLPSSFNPSTFLPPKPIPVGSTVGAWHPPSPPPKPTEAQMKAACTILAINQNNGFGAGNADSGTASVTNGIIFKQYTQYPRPTTMNPSAPNVATLMPLAAPGIFIQSSYYSCLNKK
jgi:hypothetical protein